ncbi:GNAT family N-acetyltransferase [Candidatus Riflebacteria bacterium]
MQDFQIRKREKKDLSGIREILEEHWGAARVITLGREHFADRLPGFVACAGDRLIGLLTYKVVDYELEIITLNSVEEGRGVGAALLESAKKEAISLGCKRVWLITTNDNLHALGFYQKRGFVFSAIHIDSVKESRKLKPEIPMLGNNDIPIRDEMELEFFLENNQEG